MQRYTISSVIHEQYLFSTAANCHRLKYTESRFFLFFLITQVSIHEHSNCENVTTKASCKVGIGNVSVLVTLCAGMIK